MKKFLLILFASSIITSCQNTDVEEPEITIPVPEVTHHNYFEVEDKSLTLDMAFSVDLPTYYLYFYSLTCSHCAELKDWIIEKALDNGTIYFVKASEKDVVKNDVSSSIGAENVGDICILGYPLIIKIVDKKVVKNLAGKTKIMALLENV